MTPEELDELERAAQAATLGPWEFVTEGQSTVWAGNGDIPVADIPNKHILNYGAENGPHIAKCDPQTVLSLIAAARENAALRERVKELEQKIEDEENAAWERSERE